MIFGFFTAYYDFEENLIEKFDLMIYNYLRNGFFIDILASIPLNTIYNIKIHEIIINEKLIKISSIQKNFDSDNFLSTSVIQTFQFNKFAHTKIVILFRILKFLQFIKDNYVLKQMKEYLVFELRVNPTLLNIIFFYIYFLFISHILTCLYIYLATLDNINWLSYMNLKNESFETIYIASLYFNHLTIFSIGYGDIVSKNIYERIYNIILMIIGVMLYSFAVTSISTMIQIHDEKNKVFNEKIKYLSDISEKYNLKFSLYSKLKRQIYHEKTKDNHNKFQVFGNLPLSLRNKLIMMMHEDIVRSFKFFKYTENEEFIIESLLYFKPTKSVKEDILIKQGDYLEEIIFNKEGKLNLESFMHISEFQTTDEFNELLYRDRLESKKILVLRKNQYYGDYLMIQNEKSPVSVITKSKLSELYLMCRNNVLTLSKNFPDIFNEIYKKSSLFMKSIHEIYRRFNFTKKKKTFRSEKK